MAVNQRPRYNRRKDRIDDQPIEILALAVDGAIPIDVDRTYNITKGSAAALTLAAPGAANVGRKITVRAGTNFAHVVTFTGGTLRGGTAATATATTAAFAGSGFTAVAVSATVWQLISNVACTLA